MPQGLFCPSAAEVAYTEISRKMGVSEYAIQGWGPQIVLRHLLEPKGWLGPIMLMADEISSVVFGERVWNVAYRANEESVEGVEPVSISDVDDDFVLQSYGQTPHPGISRSHAALIHQLALSRKLIIDHETKTVAIREIEGVYPNSKPLENGDYLLFPSEEMLTQAIWADILSEAASNPVLRQLENQKQTEVLREAQ